MNRSDAVMLQAVYDCMVFLQGAARPLGPAAACLHSAEAGLVKLFVSPRILTEIRDVLTRPKVQRRFPVLTPEYVEDFLTLLLRFAVVVTEVPLVFRYARDPKDEPYINLAIAAGAHYLVSRDADVLDLMDLDTPEGADFRHRFPDLTILDPVDFLQVPAHQDEAL